MTGEEERAFRALGDYLVESTDAMEGALVLADTDVRLGRDARGAAMVAEAWGRWEAIVNAADALHDGQGFQWAIDRLGKDKGETCR